MKEPKFSSGFYQFYKRILKEEFAKELKYLKEENVKKKIQQAAYDEQRKEELDDQIAKMEDDICFLEKELFKETLEKYKFKNEVDPWPLSHNKMALWITLLLELYMIKIIL